jgi:GT2 family glycosyltransferase
MISIVILSYRNPALIRLCLKSLAHAVKGEQDIEVIVVDNDSTPETRAVVTDEFADAFPSIKLVPIRNNAGYTRGVNEGIRAASGEYILSLNYDIVVEPGVIRILADYLRDHPEAGLVGPRLMNFDNSHQDSCFRFYRPFTILSRRIPLLPGADRERIRFAMRDSDHASTGPVDWVSGAAFMTTRKALDRVGLLDESLFH